MGSSLANKGSFFSKCKGLGRGSEPASTIFDAEGLLFRE